MGLSGNRALITGAARRVGHALALELARAGAHVAVHYRTSHDDAHRLVDSLRLLDVTAAALQADLDDPAAASDLVPRAADALGGPIHLLVNNASRFDHHPFLDTRVDQFDAQLHTNLRAPFLLSQALARQLGDARGAILNLNDARLRRPDGHHLAYRLSKAGLSCLTESLAIELAPRITVNQLAIGVVLPDHDSDAASLQAHVAAHVPAHTHGDLARLTRYARQLLEDPYLTGATWTYDGGEFL